MLQFYKHMKSKDAKADKIRIQIDPDLQELIPGYLENRRNDLQIYRDALEQGDFKAIAVLGHSMKGSGGGYGFQELSDIGRALENAAKSQDAKAIRKSLMDMSGFLDRLEIIYD